MHKFDEHHPEFEGFSSYFADTILPELEQGEKRRLAAVAKVRKVCVLFGCLGLAAVALAIFLGASLPIILFAGGVFGILMLGVSTHILGDLKSETKDNIMGGVCQFLGWSFKQEVEDSAYLETFLSLGLLPQGYDRDSFEDRVNGMAHGAEFEFCEAHLEDRQRTKNGETWVTLFQGQLLALKFDRKFLGQTVVLRDKGWFNSKKKGPMKRVGLVDPVFEKIFEAYGTDQVEARYLLTPTFMQRLVDLENSVDGKKIRFAFTGGHLLIAVETKNRYEAGSMFKPLVEVERTQKVLDEIGAIYNVIDGVMKPMER